MAGLIRNAQPIKVEMMELVKKNVLQDLEQVPIHAVASNTALGSATWVYVEGQRAMRCKWWFACIAAFFPARAESGMVPYTTPTTTRAPSSMRLFLVLSAVLLLCWTMFVWMVARYRYKATTTSVVTMKSETKAASASRATQTLSSPISNEMPTVIFTTRHGECYHTHEQCEGLNLRRSALERKRVCRFCNVSRVVRATESTEGATAAAST